MLTAVLPLLRCTNCLSSPLSDSASGISCGVCHRHYPLQGGILDMSGGEFREVITPFQRIMQSALIVRIYEQFWRRIGYFLASSRSFNRELATVLRLNRDTGAKLVLDLACGPGVFTRPLARQSDRTVVGVDLSWPMLRRARELLDRDQIRNVILIRASASNLPFVERAFDAINCCGALHLFDQPEVALAEIDRVTARNGFLAVQTTIRPESSAGIAFVLERLIRFGFFDEPGLRSKIARHGFEILESERHRISFTFLGRHIS